jgi:hypothetical protein
MASGSDMIDAWIRQLEVQQPDFGPLLQSTVDAVGALPAIDSSGVIRTIGDDIAFWMASGFAKAYAAQMVEYKQVSVMGADYPRLRAAGDEEGMIQALEKNKFYETLHTWIETTEPLQRRMAETPQWLAPFLTASDG